MNTSNLPADSEEYLNKENWIFLPNPGAQEHCCGGVTLSDISGLQMMSFVKNKLKTGITDLKQIKQMTGLKEKFADYGAQMLGDQNRYQRIIQRTRKFADGGAVPEEYTKMKKFDQENFTLISENFMHTKTFDYFYLPEFIPYLNSVISSDGTFSCIKNIQGIYQVYIISTQLYNEDKSKTHLQPIILVFLPNKKTETYNTMWAEMKEIFFEITGQILSPNRIHIDNESAVISSIKTNFPSTKIITCIFHIKNNFNKKMNDIGLKNRSKEVDALFKTINGILYLDLSCEFQYSMVVNFMNNILNDLTFIVPNELERVKFKKFLDYINNTYLTKNHHFFLGSISNFQEELLGDWFPQLSNNVSESLNAVLNTIFKRGFITKAACVEGIHTFYSDRRDKFRIFNDGNKANKRRKNDLKRFENLQFISRAFLALISNPLNHFYPSFLSACFFEAIYKFARVETENLTAIFANKFSSANYQPQIIIL